MTLRLAPKPFLSTSFSRSDHLSVWVNSDLEAGTERRAYVCWQSVPSIIDFLHSLDQKFSLSCSFHLTVLDVLLVQSNMLVFVLKDTCSNKVESQVPWLVRVLHLLLRPFKHYYWQTSLQTDSLLGCNLGGTVVPLKSGIFCSFHPPPFLKIQ